MKPGNIYSDKYMRVVIEDKRAGIVTFRSEGPQGQNPKRGHATEDNLAKLLKRAGMQLNPLEVRS